MIFIFQKTEKVAFRKCLERCRHTQPITTASTIKLNLKGLKYTVELFTQLSLSSNCETHLPTSLPPGRGEVKTEAPVLHSGTWVKLAHALMTYHTVPVLLFQSGLPPGKDH